jgi:hypothetical protein
MNNPRTFARAVAHDTFEHLVIGAILGLADMARDSHSDELVDAAKGRAFTLVSAWAHYLARVIIMEQAMAPLARLARELDMRVTSAVAGDVDGWKALEFDGPANVQRFPFRCASCGESLTIEVHGRVNLASATVERAAEGIARLTGWSVSEQIRGGTHPSFGGRLVRCGPCSTRPPR